MLLRRNELPGGAERGDFSFASSRTPSVKEPAFSGSMNRTPTVIVGAQFIEPVFELS